MLFKYWIDFDEMGDIKALYKDKGDCKTNTCKEYVVKLIPIDRQPADLEYGIDNFNKLSSELVSNTKKFGTELSKMLKYLDRII